MHKMLILEVIIISQDIFVLALLIIGCFTHHCFLFRTKIQSDLFLSVSCVIKGKIILPLFDNQISLLTVLAVIHRSSL